MLAVAGVWVAINLLLMGLLVGVVLENDSFAFGQADLPEDVGLLVLDLEPRAESRKDTRYSQRFRPHPANLLTEHSLA